MTSLRSTRRERPTDVAAEYTAVDRQSKRHSPSTNTPLNSELKSAHNLSVNQPQKPGDVSEARKQVVYTYCASVSEKSILSVVNCNLKKIY